MKHQQQLDWKLDLPWLSCGYQKSIHVDSSTEYNIGPPDRDAHYWV